MPARIPVPARLLTVLLLAGLAWLVLPQPAQASSASDFVSRIDAERTSRGGHALVVRGDLAAVAQAQAERMADQHTLFHNPNLAGQVGHWSMLAENVGYGPDVATIHAAFMHSAPHRTNLLNASYTEVGVGVVYRDHVMWVCEVFRKPTGSSSTSHPSSGSSGHKAPGSSSSTHPAKQPATHHAATKATPRPQTHHKTPRPAHVSLRHQHPVVHAAPLVVPVQARAALEAAASPGPPARPAAAATVAPRPADSWPTAAFVGLGLLSLVLVAAATRMRVV